MPLTYFKREKEKKNRSIQSTKKFEMLVSTASRQLDSFILLLIFNLLKLSAETHMRTFKRLFTTQLIWHEFILSP